MILYIPDFRSYKIGITIFLSCAEIHPDIVVSLIDVLISIISISSIFLLLSVMFSKSIINLDFVSSKSNLRQVKNIFILFHPAALIV